MRPLTPRQREVCQLLIQGLSIDEIASLLDCSRNTVRIHKSAVFRHFNVRTRAQFMIAVDRSEPEPS